MPRRPALALIALPNAVVLPGAVVTAEVRRPRNLRALARLAPPEAPAFERRCLVAPLADPAGEIEPAGLLPVATLAELVQRLRLPGGAERIVLRGEGRVRLGGVDLAPGGSLEAYGLVFDEPEIDPDAFARELERVLALVAALARLDPAYPADLADLVAANEGAPSALSDLVAAHLPLEYSRRARHLAEPDPLERLHVLARHLGSELEGRQTLRGGEMPARPRAAHAMPAVPRPALEVLRDELGGLDPRVSEHDRLADRIVAAELDDAARSQALHALETLRRAVPDSPATARLRNHLEWMLELPWASVPRSAEGERFDEVARAVAQSHCGLTTVKERLIEFLAVRHLQGEAHGTVLCFHGPPGTGKSSMARAVARSLLRPFVTIPVGSMTHESELVGTSYLQEAGFPGAILQELHRTGRRDLVILLDEIDKLSLGNEGNAGGALLQILDPEQNSEFLDHYLGVPFDLSACLFVVTANDLEAMPAVLLDRLEIIDFAGYTESEKAEIARAHLLPRARAACGLEDWQLKLTPSALRSVIRDYTEEAGVRDLSRRLHALARKAAVEVVRGKKGLLLRKSDLARRLGAPTVDDELRFQKPSVGVATGLAWTTHGGALLPIEALAMPGSGHMILTGQVGEVMRESVQAATSWVRRRLKDLGLAQDLFERLDLHLHFPSGGTPKDGPSAGIAIATAIVSLIARVPARHDVAMTGEMSLLGHVLPVGGLREKLLAAIRAGIPEVIVPNRNAEELLRMPAEIRSRLAIHLVDDVLEVLGIALLTPASREAQRAGAPRRRSARRAGGARRARSSASRGRRRRGRGAG
jgi:ATP-dependent Lon protease